MLRVRRIDVRLAIFREFWLGRESSAFDVRSYIQVMQADG